MSKVIADVEQYLAEHGDFESTSYTALRLWNDHLTADFQLARFAATVAVELDVRTELLRTAQALRTLLAAIRDELLARGAWWVH